jgi:signal peptidase I
MPRRFLVADQSMSPALRPGDRLLGLRRRPRRGEVVAFQHPLREGFWLVKRAVGLPGETVVIEAGEVLVDGLPLDVWSTDATEPPGEWRLGEEEVFVLSDARHRSRADSRELGPLPTSALWALVVRYRPLTRLGLPYR